MTYHVVFSGSSVSSVSSTSSYTYSYSYSLSSLSLESSTSKNGEKSKSFKVSPSTTKPRCSSAASKSDHTWSAVLYSPSSHFLKTSAPGGIFANSVDARESFVARKCKSYFGQKYANRHAQARRSPLIVGRAL